MARFAAVLLIAAFGAAAAAGSCSGGVCVEVQAEQSSDVGVELLQRGKEKKGEKQIPGLDGILDAGRNVLNNVSDTVNSVVGNVSDTVSKTVNTVVSNVTDTVSKEVGSAANSLASPAVAAAVAVASTLNSTLLALGEQTDTLFATCETLRKSIIEKVSKTRNDTYARLNVLEQQVNTAVGQVLPVWDNISASVVTASAVATTALASLGQEGTAEKLNASLSIALEQANSVAESLENVTIIMESLRNVTEQELSEGLAQVQGTLQTGLAKADSFATRMSTAFDNLTDEVTVKITAVLPLVNVTPIDDAFDSVDNTVKRVTDDLIDGPRQLVFGLSEAVGMVEKTLPEDRNSAHQATSYIAHALVLGLLATAL